jgi:hypothetical protein
MNHFFDQATGELYAYDDEQVAQGLVEEGLTPCPTRPSNDHQWNGGWVLPSPAIPQSVTPLQATRALLQAGFLDAVEVAVAAADRETQLAWAKATAFERNSPFVLDMKAVLGWTDEQVDQLFILANSL